jgi:curli biogenesis system outer membrane secretion channel CsgG
MTGKRPFALGLLAAVLALSGCTTTGADSYKKVRPKTDVQRTSTSFSRALQCMDDQFLAHGISGVKITSVGIPDATGKVSSGTRDMLISAVSQMTARSRAFRYIDLEYDNTERRFIRTLFCEKNKEVCDKTAETPEFYIRGAITQLDDNVMDRRLLGSLEYEDEKFTGQADAGLFGLSGVLALDLNVVDVLSQEIVPGLTANNSLAIQKAGTALAGAVALQKLGVSLDFTASEAEGVHYAVRTLVELGAIELLGKLAQVPYWECLEVESTNPQVLNQMQEWWKGMSEGERIRFSQRALIANGYLAPPETGRLDEATKAAIARFQAERGVVVTGRPSFELYAEALGSDRPLAAGPPKTFTKKGATADPAKDRVPVRTPVELTLYTERGAKPVFQPRDAFRMAVQLSKSAFLYCFYRDAGGSVARIFPNRFQPDPFLPAGQPVEIPGRGAFDIVFEVPGAEEEVACVASDREVGLDLPDALKVADLTPLPVENLDQLIARFQEIDRAGLGVARLPLLVERAGAPAPTEAAAQ